MTTIENKLCVKRFADPAISEVAESAVYTIWQMAIISAPFILFSSPVGYSKYLHDIHTATKSEDGGIVGAYAFPILFANQSGKVCRRGRVFLL